MALPYINLYIGDLKKDTDLLSPAAFGGYMRLLLFHMHEAKNRGQVTFTLPQLCRIFGAPDLQETQLILQEIVNPEFEIVDYAQTEAGYFIRNRRMVRETAISQVRSESGKKGAEKTNAKNRQNKKDAEEFDAAKAAAQPEQFAEANSVTNDVANKQQNYNNNINTNSGINQEGVIGEETPVVDEAAIIPRMLTEWKAVKPKYILRPADDLPALAKILKIILKEERLSLFDAGADERVLVIWIDIARFIHDDKHFTTYQLTQVEKYFAAIASKYVVAKENPQGQKSIIATNKQTSDGASEIIKRKYQNQN